MKDTICRWFAYMLPKRVAYWAAIRVHAFATVQPENASKHPDEVTHFEALDHWHRFIWRRA